MCKNLIIRFVIPVVFNKLIKNNKFHILVYCSTVHTYRIRI